MEASAPGSRRASHRLNGAFLPIRPPLLPVSSIPICLSSAPTTFFTIGRWTVEMYLVPRLHFCRANAPKDDALRSFRPHPDTTSEQFPFLRVPGRSRTDGTSARTWRHLQHHKIL